MSSPALSFGSTARLYDSIRPTYPVPAITWAIGAEPVRVLDLGAGTGLLTGALHAAGHEVIAVEPDEQMRAVAAERHPDTRILAGSAEDIPLPDESVDAVVVGQAYHWFTPQDALPQMHRVLRADGVLAAMWNIRDDRTPWVAALSGIVGSEGYGMESAWPYGPVTPWFTDPERGLTEHTVTVPTDRLTDLVRSRSSYLTADAAEQARLDREITELATTDPALADRDTIDVPYRTCAYRMRRI
ncbi:class I SAM-dependent methyltransferase [Streptomyces sp. TRM66268-LWL]|uniref:Class I SAM-dependent methyltransferase n=1 Tax=Streptomyces polyasparticus TaxID=2767826 RepID=A0ABR7STU9_9ACTN|nr:class I SAM-dependent methyltransferase [Streptomyces polyasparticus]MBC9717713.1 class I SAM-dependent methyltransferase [Streptomyces polyasparticus]